ncbi:MFS transporter [Alicyclobacillus tolerans]|uniref:MFS family permease n=1 Tax=Alicyclobacillus tolerans TaxID=90970 RepID=A0ABT9LSU5_9BACL|nr:MFS transporter [Alicyclobacillus tengchongensis]MDP9727323.1 MFS family permease [Alicyclobacillus tengchongensis]
MDNRQATLRWKQAVPRESYTFVAASLVNSIGSSLLWPLITIYVHNVLHRNYAEAGFALLLQALMGVLGQFVGGALYEKVGPKRLIVGSLLMTGFAQFSLIFAKAWVPYLIAMMIIGFLNQTTMPAVNAFVGFRWPQHRNQLFNLMYVSNNIGVAVGTSLAGLLASISFNLTFLFNGLTTIFFALFFYQYLRKLGLSLDQFIPFSGQAGEQSSLFSLLLNMRLYLFLAIGSLLTYLATSAWNSGAAPYLNQHGQPPSMYSWLWTVNGLVILLGQPFTSMLNRWLTKSLNSRLIASALFYACGFSIIWIRHSPYIWLMMGMIIATFGEMLMSPVVPAIITQTTGRNAAFYLGVVGSVGTVGRLVGPPYFGYLFDQKGISPILLAATVSSLLAAFSFIVFSWWLKQGTYAGEEQNIPQSM